MAGRDVMRITLNDPRVISKIYYPHLFEGSFE